MKLRYRKKLLYNLFDPAEICDSNYSKDGGHSKSGRAFQPTTLGRRTCRRLKKPDWVNNKKKVGEFLLRLFPSMQTNARVKRRALLYAGVLIYYFRLDMNARETTYALNRRWLPKPITVTRVYRIVQSIRRAAAGQRTDGRPRTFGKAGRPRRQQITKELKSAVCTQTNL